MLAIFKLLPLIWNLTSGYKTYVGVALAGASILANHFGFQIPGVEFDSANWLSDLFKVAMIATMRHAVK